MYIEVVIRFYPLKMCFFFLFHAELWRVCRVASQPRPTRRTNSSGRAEFLLYRRRRGTIDWSVPVVGRRPSRADVELGGCGSPAPEPPVHGHRSHVSWWSATAERHAQASGGRGRPVSATGAARPNRVPVLWVRVVVATGAADLWREGLPVCHTAATTAAAASTARQWQRVRRRRQFDTAHRLWPGRLDPRSWQRR